MLAFSSILAEYLRKFEFLISQGIVATCLRWGGRCHTAFVANFIRFWAVQKFWESVKIWQSYREFKGGTFFETQCMFNTIVWSEQSTSLLILNDWLTGRLIDGLVTKNYRPTPFFFARSSIIAVGSDPMDSRQIIGVRQSLSSHMAFRSRMTGSAYFGPIESAMYLRACDVVLSGHHDLQSTVTTYNL